MADDITTNVQFIGHGLRAEAKTGMNGGLNPSAVRTDGLDFQGKPLPRGTVAQSIMRENKAKHTRPDDPTWQQRQISAAPIATTPGMRNVNASPAKVPAANVRKATTDGVVRPVRR